MHSPTIPAQGELLALPDNVRPDRDASQVLGPAVAVKARVKLYSASEASN